MLEWWRRWFDRAKETPIQSYDRFTAEFAKEFNKQYPDLMQKEPLDYWRLFRRERDSAWREYQKK